MCDTQELDNVLIRLRGNFQFWSHPQRRRCENPDYEKLLHEMTRLYGQVSILVQIDAGNNFRQREEIRDLHLDILQEMDYLNMELELEAEETE